MAHTVGKVHTLPKGRLHLHKSGSNEPVYQGVEQHCARAQAALQQQERRAAASALKLQSGIEASKKVPTCYKVAATTHAAAATAAGSQLHRPSPSGPSRLFSASAGHVSACVCPRSSFSCFNMPAACSPQPSCTVRLLSGPRACSLCLCCPCERLRLPPQLLLLL